MRYALVRFNFRTVSYCVVCISDVCIYTFDMQTTQFLYVYLMWFLCGLFFWLRVVVCVWFLFAVLLGLFVALFYRNPLMRDSSFIYDMETTHTTSKIFSLLSLIYVFVMFIRCGLSVRRFFSFSFVFSLFVSSCWVAGFVVSSLRAFCSPVLSFSFVFSLFVSSCWVAVCFV